MIQENIKVTLLREKTMNYLNRGILRCNMNTKLLCLLFLLFFTINVSAIPLGESLEVVTIESEGASALYYAWDHSVDSIIVDQNIEKGVSIVINGDLDKLVVGGNMLGVIHVTGNIGSIDIGSMTNEDYTDGDIIEFGIITAQGNIGDINISLLMKNSYIVAGVNPGIRDNLVKGITAFAPEELRVDGLVIDPAEDVINGKIGNIGDVHIGTLNNSVIAAGVLPGNNYIWGDQDATDKVAVVGISSIGKVVIDLIETSTNTILTYGVFADTDIEKLTLGKSKIVYPITLANGFTAWTVDFSDDVPIFGAPIQKGVPFKGTVGGLVVSVKMSGPGSGEVVIDPLQFLDIKLKETTKKTKLYIKTDYSKKNGEVPINVGNLYNGADDPLGLLALDGKILETLDIGGGIDKLSIGGLDEGGTIQIGGNVSRASLGHLSNIDPQSQTTVNVYGDIKKLNIKSFNEMVEVWVDNVTTCEVKGNLDGRLNIAGDLLDKLKVSESVTGIVNCEGSIESIVIKKMLGQSGEVDPLDPNSFAFNRNIQGIRAKKDIDKFEAKRISKAVVAAGRSIGSVVVEKDVTFSTIAAGLDINDDCILNSNDLPKHGNLNKVKIYGKFKQSNIVAGMNFGDDYIFGNGDDKFEHINAENIEMLTISDVIFDVADLSIFKIQFSAPPQRLNNSTIGSVTIKGGVVGSEDVNHRYAIAAAGIVDKVTVGKIKYNGTAFFEIPEKSGNKDTNVIIQEINLNEPIGSSIRGSIDNHAEALAAAISITGAGFDQVFGTSDDVFVMGDGDPDNTDTVNVVYDDNTMQAVFKIDDDSFQRSLVAANLFQIKVRSDAVTNRQGIALDGEYGGFPTGDGTPGGDFIYNVSVGDLSDFAITAHEVVGQVVSNSLYALSSTIGDTPGNNNAVDDKDILKFPGLLKGQVLNIDLASTTGSYETDVYPFLSKVNDNELFFQSLRNFQWPGMPIPYVHELAYVYGKYYVFDGVGHKFYTFAPEDNSIISRLDNTLDDLNNFALASDDGAIYNLHAMCAHSHDSLWAVADYIPDLADFQPGVAYPEMRLVIIRNISDDVTALEKATVEILDEPIVFVGAALTDTRPDVRNIEYVNGKLYGVDSNDNALLSFVINPASSDYGRVENVWTLKGDELIFEGLNITGLSINPSDPNGLMALHDQVAGSLLLTDAIYDIDVTPGDTSMKYTSRYLFAGDTQRQGLGAKPESDVVVGNPRFHSLAGDQFDIELDPQEDESFIGTHTFATQTTKTILPGGWRLYSDRTEYLENYESLDFADNNYYYQMLVEFPLNQGIHELHISDIQWRHLHTELGTTQPGVANGVVEDILTDQPSFVTADLVQNHIEQTSTIILEIDTDNATTSEVLISFATTSYLEKLIPSSTSLVGTIIGDPNRIDIGAIERHLLVSDLTEYTLNPEYYDEDLEVFDPFIFFWGWYSPWTFGLDGSRVSDNGYGYDADQDIFVTISAYSFVSIIQVGNPYALVPETINLTGEELSAIFSRLHVDSEGDPIYERLSNFRGLEMGPDGAVYMIVTVEMADPAVPIDDYLLVVGDLESPGSDMQLSNWGLKNRSRSGFAQRDLYSDIENEIPYEFSDVQDIAYSEDIFLNEGTFAAIDRDSNTLFYIDGRRVVEEGSNNDVVVNDHFGAIKNFMQITPNNIGNIGNGPNVEGFDFTGLSYNSFEELYAVDNHSDSIVGFDLFGGSTDNTSHSYIAKKLPAGNYQAFSFEVEDPEVLFDSAAWWTRFWNSFFGIDTSGLRGTGYLVDGVIGSPVDTDLATSGDQRDVMSIFATTTGTISGALFDNAYAFGGVAPDYTDVPTWGTHTSAITAINSAAIADDDINSDPKAEGMYYIFEVAYLDGAGKGTISLLIGDIDWPTGGAGFIHSVVVDDLNAEVITFGDNELLVEIDTDATVADGTVTILFGASSQLMKINMAELQRLNVFPHEYSKEIRTKSSDYGTGAVDIGYTYVIPEDGDYLIEMELPEAFDWGNNTNGENYEIVAKAHDDGNSDFGVSAVTSGYPYLPEMPTNNAIYLGPDVATEDCVNSDTQLRVDCLDSNIYWFNSSAISGPALQPYRVVGKQGDGNHPLLEPGIKSEVTVSSALDVLADVDVYRVILTHGQKMTVDLEMATLFGQTADYGATLVGVYNSDLESVAVIWEYGNDDDVLPAPELIDPIYTIQAAFDGDYDFDPDNGDDTATYYIVVSQQVYNGNGYTSAFQSLPYDLKITTTAPEDFVEPPSQLVWLVFDGGETPYLGVHPGTLNVYRQPFDIYDFGLLAADRDVVINGIVAEIEQMYADTGLIVKGLNDDNGAIAAEIEFTRDDPKNNAPSRSIYSRVIFSGTTAAFGLAQRVDRSNLHRQDDAVVATTVIGSRATVLFSDGHANQVAETIQLLANIGAHEAGHILGLEHSLEEGFNSSTAKNIMNPGDGTIVNSIDPRTFIGRNNYVYQSLGFINSKMLLNRYIGSGTPLGE